jgi:hypothetical protein
MNQKARLSRFANILASLLFAMASLSFFKSGQVLYGFILLIIACLNMFVLVYLNYNLRLTKILLNLFNAIAAGLTAYDYYIKGADYIHYVWLLSMLMFLAVNLVLLLKIESKLTK